MPRRALHSKDEIRELALQATEQLVQRQGYGALSTRKLAASMGYTVGSLYLAFRNLDDLVLHVNARTLDALLAELVDAARDARTPREAINRLARAYIHFAETHQQLWSMLFEHRLQPDSRIPDWYEEKIFQVFQLVEHNLRQAAPQRSFEESKLAARALWSSIHGIAVLCLHQKFRVAGVESVNNLTHSLVANFLVGFAGECGQ